jgi:hypothetical protein
VPGLKDDPADDMQESEDDTTKAANKKSIFLETCAPITHAELTEKLREGGYVRSAVLEAQDDSREPRYAVFLLVSWRKGYCVLHVHWPARPRMYRDLDRLLALLRFDYRFTGTVAIKCANDASEGKRHRRATL